MSLISVVSDDTVTVFVGGKPFIIASDHAQYDALRDAIAAGDDEAVEKIALAAESFSKLLGAYGDVQVYGGHITFQGQPVAGYLVDRILQLMRAGLEPSSHGFFLDRVMRNPLASAREELFQWLERAKMPMLPDGRFAAWKVIRADYTDKHTGKMNNAPGARPEMPREAVNANRNVDCASGLHFCGPSYFGTFYSHGDRVVLLAVDPLDVVSFPQDSGGQKGRACRYEILFEVENANVATNWFTGKDQIVFDAVAWFEQEYPFEVVESGNGEILRRFKFKDEADKWAAAQTKKKAVVVEPEVKTAPTEANPAPIDPTALASGQAFFERLNTLAMLLALNIEGFTIAGALDAIENELGLDDHTPPQIARLMRAEKAAGL